MSLIHLHGKMLTSRFLNLLTGRFADPNFVAGALAAASLLNSSSIPVTPTSAADDDDDASADDVVNF